MTGCCNKDALCEAHSRAPRYLCQNCRIDQVRSEQEQGGWAGARGNCGKCLKLSRKTCNPILCGWRVRWMALASRQCPRACGGTAGPTWHCRGRLRLWRTSAWSPPGKWGAGSPSPPPTGAPGALRFSTGPREDRGSGPWFVFGVRSSCPGDVTVARGGPGALRPARAGPPGSQDQGLRLFVPAAFPVSKPQNLVRQGESRGSPPSSPGRPLCPGRLIPWEAGALGPPPALGWAVLRPVLAPGRMCGFQVSP